MSEAEDAVAAAQAELNDLEALKGNPGWKVYDSFLHLQERTMEQAVASAKDAYSQSVAVGAWKAVKDLRTWPDRQITILRQIISGSVSG